MTAPTPFDGPTPTERLAVVPDRPSRLDLELGHFFDVQASNRTAPTQARYRRVQTRLHQFLDDVDVTRSAGAEPAARLAAERDRGRHGAFGRVLGFEELLGCLEEFVQEPWLPSTPAERRTHISLTERLARHLRRRRLIDPFVAECLYLDVLDAVRGARWELRARPSGPVREALDDGFAGRAAGSSRRRSGLRLVQGEASAGDQARV